MDEWMDESMNEWAAHSNFHIKIEVFQSSVQWVARRGKATVPHLCWSARWKKLIAWSSASFLQNGRISSRRSSEWSLAWSSWILKWCQSEQHGSSIFLVTCIFKLNYNNINPRDLHLCPFLFLNPLSHWSHSKSEQISNKSHIMYNQIFYMYTYTYTKKYVRTPSHQVQYGTSD